MSVGVSHKSRAGGGSIGTCTRQRSGHLQSPLILSQPMIIYLSRGTLDPTSLPSHNMLFFIAFPLHSIFFTPRLHLLPLTHPLLTLLSLPHFHTHCTYFSQLHYLVLGSIMGESSNSSASYIHMVQHLIEKCLIFHMSKEECMEALSKHANIKPVITSTVWKELEKENKDFFEEYAKAKSKEDRMSEEETSQMIQKMISDSTKGGGND
ncbi:hypothetical protein VNO80_08226 [Phaseolus coccineus]|uniref:Uncharacterized protein n=1 Tax=Phaseolus coccineus TaxID=3886 RepID=A0AAN9NL57_PHACN